MYTVHVRYLVPAEMEGGGWVGGWVGGAYQCSLLVRQLPERRADHVSIREGARCFACDLTRTGRWRDCARGGGGEGCRWRRRGSLGARKGGYIRGCWTLRVRERRVTEGRWSLGAPEGGYLSRGWATVVRVVAASLLRVLVRRCGHAALGGVGVGLDERCERRVLIHRLAREVGVYDLE